MTNQSKLALNYLHADLAALDGLLAKLTEEDVITRLGLEDRRDELLNRIRETENLQNDNTASATLIFEGKPVSGMYGIESKFATSAVSTFQNLVAMILAQKSGSLSQRGTVAKRESSTLYITNLARGSVGFVLEEVLPQNHSTDIPLSEAVNETTNLLNAFSTSHETDFQEWLGSMNQRIITSAGKFFELMSRNEATLRLVTGKLDHSYGIEDVARAADRARNTNTKKESQAIFGQLAGILPDSRQFEFKCENNRRSINGRTAHSLSIQELNRFNRDLLNINAKAQFEVTRVYRSRALVRENYSLVSLVPVKSTKKK